MKITNNTIQANNPVISQEDEKLKKACDDFSALFVSMLWKEMRNTIPENGFVPKSNAEKIFQEMMDGELSKEMAKSEGFSLSRVLYEQMKLGMPQEKNKA